METTLHIKNMVCNRCMSTVERELNELGYEVKSVQLGQVVLNTNTSIKDSELEDILKKHGFEIIKDETVVLIEEIKIALIKKIENQDDSKLSSFLEKNGRRSYAALSKLFSKSEGMTIEKYLINLKMEKVKELIQLGQLNFSEIAYNLNYTSSGHLARQFKNLTGMSMSEFRDLQRWDRKSLDQIV